MEDREQAEGRGQTSQQLRCFQVRGEKWMLKLKLLILAVLCVLLGAFLGAYKLQAHIQNCGKKHEFLLSEHNHTLMNYSMKLAEKGKIILQLQTENTNLRSSLTEKGKRIEQLQTENTNLNSSLTEKEHKMKQLEEEKGTCDLNFAAQNVNQLCCAEGWKYFSGKCYYFSIDKKTWNDSRDTCLTAGGDLVIITIPGEQEFIKRSKPGSGAERYWIGLTDAVKEGDWRWLDGTELSKTPKYWNENEPDNWTGGNREYPEGEDCAQMEVSSTHYSLWDGLCDAGIAIHKRVCEAKASK